MTSTTLEFAEYAPSTPLRPFVRCVWTLAGPAAAARTPQPVVPDGCMELVFNLAAPFERYRTDGSFIERQPRELIVGPSTGPAVIVATGVVDLIGVRLHPWGASAFLGVPAGALRDELLPIDDVSRELARLTERLEEHRDLDARVGTLMRVLAEVHPRSRPDPALRRAVSIVGGMHPLPSLRDIASGLGKSVRWVQRGFEREVGLNPKMVARIARVQRAMRIADRSPTLNWSAVAAEAGYFDQSHLVRDFRQLVGCPPSELEARAGELTEVFLTGE